LQNIGALLQEMDARVTLSGHTDSKAFGNAQRGYSNWELSADRANASRRELLAGGMAEDRIFRVIGLAASVPINTEDASASINRRISIIVMNKQAEARLMTGSETKDASDADDVRELLDTAPSAAAIADAGNATAPRTPAVGALRALPSGSTAIPQLK
jgi:chemotaxis protein MotB